jgi:hypothetical protein
MSIPEEITMYKNLLCTKSNDFIWGREIDHVVCDGLLDFWDNQRFLTVAPGQVYAEGEPTVVTSYKESMDCMVPHQIAMPHVQEYMQALQGVLDEYIQRFPFCNTSRFQIVEPLSMQCYPKGGGFKEWHTERLNALPGTAFRHLVFMTYLNDVPDGGTEWYHQDKYVEAKKGYTVIWPADWTHFHRGRVSKDHEKKIITGWFAYV